jgi:hypothetical protein
MSTNFFLSVLSITAIRIYDLFIIESLNRLTNPHLHPPHTMIICLLRFCGDAHFADKLRVTQSHKNMSSLFY